MILFEQKPVTELFKEGFERSRGVRLKFFGAFFIFVVISGIVGAIAEAIFHAEAYMDAGEYANYVIASLFQELVPLPITIPLGAGLIMVALIYVREARFEMTALFNYYIYVWTLFFAAMLTNIAIVLGLVLLIIPGIYLGVAFMFVNILIVEQKIGFIDAIKKSYTLITRHWFYYFWFAILASLINIAGALALLVGLVFTLPTTLLAFILLYEQALQEEASILQQSA